MATKSEIRRVSIYINGSEAEMQLGGIEKGAKKLKNELSRLVPGTEEFKRKLLELRETRKVIQDVNDDIKGVGGAFGWLKTEVGKLGMLATGFLGLQFITQQFQNVISQNAKLADSISDVQKTTGMSELAVRRLQKSFKDIDTRTSRADLTSLAEVAGKLGITGEKDVLGFVRAADQINVALGKDLGNAEEAINSLGKLTEIFHIKDDYGLEQALLKTGSAINGLGAAGTANEGYIVEFTKRLGGIAPQAKMSIQDVMALGAVMDELGQPVEAAATAIGQFVVGMGNDTAKFASIAGMTKKAFEELLSKDGTAALKAVLGGLKSTGQGVQGLAENMGMIGEDGARATAALGLLSNNLELLNVRQQQSSKLFEEGTSLTAEYNVKNNNFAATLDRLSKKFNELTSNSSLTKFFTGVISVTASFIDWLNRSIGAIGTLIKFLTIGGVAWLTYSTYVALANSTQLAFLVGLVKGESVMALSRTATIALAGAKALLSGNMEKAAQAMRLLNVTMEANPIGAVIAVVMAIVTAIILFNNEMDDAAKAQVALNDVLGEAEKSVKKETTALQLAQETLKKRTASKLEEANAIKTIRELMPDHLKDYTDEEIRAGKATVAIDKYVESLMKRARATAAQNKLDSIAAQMVDLEIKKKNGWNALSTWDQIKYGFPQAFDKDLKKQMETLKVQKQQIEEMFGGDILANTAQPKPNMDGGTGGVPAFNIKTATKDQLDQQLAKDTKELAQLKQGTIEYNKVAAEMVAIRKRLRDIGKDTGVGGGGREEDPVKKAAATYKQLQKEVKALSGKALVDTLNKNQKEIHDAEQKYKTLIDKEKDFLKQKGTTAAQRAQTATNIANLEKDMAVDVANITVRQEKEMRDKILSLRTSLGNAYETERQKEISRINNFYDDLWQNTATDEQRTEIEAARAKDLTDAKIREEKRLKDETEELRQQGVVTAADRDKVEMARINKKYDDQVEALKKKYSKELQQTQEFQDALAIIQKNRVDDTTQYEKDKDDDVKKAIYQAAYDTARQISDAYFEIGADNRRAETDAEIAKLEKRKDSELANKNLTEQQRQSIERKYAKQEADIKLKAWKADQSAKKTQAMINGALAVTMALASSPPPFNWINAAAVGAATLIQVIKIGKEKPPQFEDGGFSSVEKRKPSGWVKSPTLFANSASGRDFIAGEKYKGEYIISSEQLKDPVISNFVGMMENNRGVRRFEAGGYSSVDVPVRTVTIPGEAKPPQYSVDLEPLIREQKLTRAAMKDMKVMLNTQLFNKKMDKLKQIETDANA